jgi:hypothetical protein
MYRNFYSDRQNKISIFMKKYAIFFIYLNIYIYSREQGTGLKVSYFWCYPYTLNPVVDT